MTPDSPAQHPTPPSPLSDLLPGSRLGKYQVINRLALGGMAEILLARATGAGGFQKVFAIKRILPELVRKEGFVNMFLDEARIAATLEHPNIVATYDVGEVDGNYFMAMEYLHGEDLRYILYAVAKRGEQVPFATVVGITTAIAAALHYAHTKVGFDGKPQLIVHRDVTPQNVIVTYDGGIKLLDFGIAKATNRFEETRAGATKGKLSYMSPEQCRAEPLDARSDIFALGIILYELSVCKKLFSGPNDLEILKKIVEKPVPPPSTLRKDYPPALEAIVMRALEKDPARRYQSVKEMQLALEALARDERLFFSATEMAAYMESLFGAKVEAWRDAQAQGLSLADHLESQSISITVSDEVLRSVDGTSGVIDLPASDTQRAPMPVPPGEGTDPAMSEASSVRRAVAWTERNPAWMYVPAAACAIVAAVLISIGVMRHRTHQAPPVAPVAVAPPEPVAPPTLPPPAKGRIEVRTTPPGAQLLLDGKPAADATPASLGDLPPGEHALVIRAAGHREETRNVVLRAGETLTLELALVEDKHAPTPRTSRHGGGSSSSPGTGKGPALLVIASSPWCNVSVDGTPRGQTPLSLSLPAGRHTILLTNPDAHIKRTLPLSLRPGETLRKKLDFE